MEDKTSLFKIKSLNIQKTIIKYLNNKKILKFVKYNLKLQNKLKISLLNYDEYMKTYSEIIIELIPVENTNGIFINIRKEDINYIHIYINNSRVEIKRNYIKPNEIIAKIIIKLDYQFNNFKYLFYDCKCIKSITFIKFFRNNIFDMSYLFCKCINLYEVNFNSFNTDNVINMCYMFYKCKNLTNVDLNKFNNLSGINMEGMFNKCYKLLRKQNNN